MADYQAGTSDPAETIISKTAKHPNKKLQPTTQKQYYLERPTFTTDDGE
jgi:hypothetical protein